MIVSFQYSMRNCFQNNTSSRTPGTANLGDAGTEGIALAGLDFKDKTSQRLPVLQESQSGAPAVASDTRLCLSSSGS